MKKISPRKYAQTLYELVADKKQEELEPVLKKFAGLLVENGDVSKLDRVIKEFREVWNREKGIVEGEVVSATELDRDVLNNLQNVIKDLSGSEVVNINNKVDRGILGGVIIRYGDKRIDSSLKTQINRLRNKLYN